MMAPMAMLIGLMSPIGLLFLKSAHWCDAISGVGALYASPSLPTALSFSSETPTLVDGERGEVRSRGWKRED